MLSSYDFVAKWLVLHQAVQSGVEPASVDTSPSTQPMTTPSRSRASSNTLSPSSGQAAASCEMLAYVHQRHN